MSADGHPLSPSSLPRWRGGQDEQGFLHYPASCLELMTSVFWQLPQPRRHTELSALNSWHLTAAGRKRNQDSAPSGAAAGGGSTVVTRKHRQDPQGQPRRRKRAQAEGSRQKHCPQNPAACLPYDFSAFPKPVSRHGAQLPAALTVCLASIRKLSKQA